jgi:plasmid stability protein
MNELSIPDMVAAYLNIRAARDQLSMEYEQKDAALKKDLTELEQMMLALCTELGVNSLNTPMGTVSRSLKERYSCTDWGNFYDFVREHNAPELLEKRIHQGNMKTLLESTEDEGLPPGVSVMREYSVTVRKPTR